MWDVQTFLQHLLCISPSKCLRSVFDTCGMGGLAHSHQKSLAERPEWRLALCMFNETLALWRHEELYLLSPRDNYAQPFALWRSVPDELPHRRCLAWNGDGSLLAGCTSMGVIYVLDARARLLHTLPPDVWMQDTEVGEPLAIAGQATPCSNSIVDLTWRDPPGGKGSELLLLGADAVLRRLSIASSSAFTRANPSVSNVVKVELSSQHALVTCLSYDQSSDLLAVGGAGGVLSPQARLLLAKSQKDATAAEPLSSFSIWTLSSVAQFPSLLFSSTSANMGDEKSDSVNRLATFFRLLRAVHRAWWLIRASVIGDGVPHTLRFCGGGSRLAVLTVCGELSVWQTDHLVQHSRHAQSPAGIGDVDSSRDDGTSPLVPEPPLRFRNGRTGSADEWMSVEWWDARSLILASRSGSVCVCALPHLVNLLGAQPERFARLPALSVSHAGRFFILECELRFWRQPMSALAATHAAVSNPTTDSAVRVADGAGAIGEFAQEKGPIRVRSWRLLSLRQTSPEQLFMRKVPLPPRRLRARVA